ncbi:MAG: hypothetical protein K9K86_07745 [Pseudomonadales bacterium]|nr:hypothetical protein [Pseudomonadales bacterium]
MSAAIPTVYLTARHYRVSIPGLDIRAEPGDTTHAVEPLQPNLMRSNQARRSLENVLKPDCGQPSKKILGPKAVELAFCKEMG